MPVFSSEMFSSEMFSSELWAEGVGAVWTPAALFADGQQGVWLDPSDLSTVFRNSVGTTAAGVGDPVGLVLDKSEELVWGPELVTNGAFDTDTSGWMEFETANGTGTLSWVSGSAKVTIDSGFDVGLKQTIVGLEVGKSYRVSFDYDKTGLTSKKWLTAAIPGGNVDRRSVDPDTGTAAFIFTASATSDDLIIRSAGIGDKTGESFTVDNIAVRERPGHPASQSTDASRPILRQDAEGRYWLDDDGVDDSMTVSLPAMSATSTVAYSRPGIGAEISTVDLSAGGAYTVDGDWHELVIVGDQLSTADQVRLRQYLDARAGV